MSIQSTIGSRSSRFAAPAALVLLGSLYTVVALAVLPTEGFWSPDSGSKFLQMQAIRWEGGLRYSIPYLGRDLDPGLRLVPLGPTFYEERQGDIYMVWPLVFPLLSKPLFHFLGFPGLLVIPVLAGLGTVWVSYLIALRLCSRRLALLALALTALATPVFIYSVLFWEHTLVTFLATLGVWLLLRGTSGQSRPSLVGAGSALALAGALRAEVYVLLAALPVAWVAWQRGRSLWVGALPAGIAFVMVSLPFWLIYLREHGSPLPLNAARNFLQPSLSYLAERGTLLVNDLLVGDKVKPGGAFQFSVVAMLAVAMSYLPPRFRGAPMTLLSLAVLALLAFQIVQAYYGESMPDTMHGFLALSPFLVFGLLRTAHERRSAPVHGERRFLHIFALLYLAFYLAAVSLMSPYGPNGGGLEWGPRFLLTIYPLLVPLAVASLEGMVASSKQRTLKALYPAAFVVLALLAVAFQARGIWVIREEKSARLAMAQALEKYDESYVVAEVWWFPTMVGATQFQQKRFFVADTPEKFQEWLKVTREHHLPGFLLASFLPPERNPLLARDNWPPDVELEVEKDPPTSYGVLFMRVRLR